TGICDESARLASLTEAQIASRSVRIFSSGVASNIRSASRYSIPMKPGKITHTIAALLSSISALFVHGTVTKAEPTKSKFSKKSEKKARSESGIGVGSLVFAPTRLCSAPPSSGERYPWKRQIVTTVFWIGEKPSENNPVPNKASSWDNEWSKSYGGLDDPN